MNIFEAYEKHKGEKISLPDWPPEEWIRWDDEEKQLVNDKGHVLANVMCYRDDYELWQPLPPKTYTNEEAYHLLMKGHAMRKEGRRPIKMLPIESIVYADPFTPHLVDDHLIAEMFAVPGEWTKV